MTAHASTLFISGIIRENQSCLFDIYIKQHMNSKMVFINA